MYRLPLYPQAGDVTHGLIINYSTKEKKQKSEYTIRLEMTITAGHETTDEFLSRLYRAVMRLGKKKEKDRELEKQCIDGIARLICSPKQSHPVPLRGEFGVRFISIIDFENILPFRSEIYF